MRINPILELKQADMTKQHSEFYRYNIGGAKVWFDQCNKTGHIYMVYVGLPKELEDFQVYVDCDANKLFYPVNIYMQSASRRCSSEEALTLAEQVIHVKAIMESIETLFGSGSMHHHIWTECQAANTVNTAD
jgi:hypothetical protein